MTWSMYWSWLGKSFEIWLVIVLVGAAVYLIIELVKLIRRKQT